MFRLSALSSLSLSVALIACEPASPIIEGGPAPADGIWEMEITAVTAKGRCSMGEFSELEGLLLTMDVQPKGEHGIRFDIEGLSLKGFEDGGFMHAEGRIAMDATVSVVVDDSTDPDEPDVGDEDISEPVQEGHRTEAPDYERPDGEGMHAELEATTRTTSWMSGELLLEYDRPDMKCILSLEFEAHHEDELDRRPKTEPYPEPATQETKDEDIAVSTEED